MNHLRRSGDAVKRNYYNNRGDADMGGVGSPPSMVPQNNRHHHHAGGMMVSESIFLTLSIFTNSILYIR